MAEEAWGGNGSVGLASSKLTGHADARVKVTLEIAAEFPNGAPENVVRIVTENARTLKFTSQEFEED